MNSLLIKGIQKTSLIDYPGKISAIIFLARCNFRCPFCYNRDLVLEYDKLPTIKEEDVLEFLKKRKKWLDGVVLTGGEPTLYRELEEFIKKIKELGYLIKLDTNGANPSMIKELIDKKLIDYIAMDIKAPLERYDKVAKVKVNKKDIQKSIDIIQQSKVDHEFRMTMVPGLVDENDIIKIGKWLKSSKKFFIQQFIPDKKCIDESYSNKKPLPAKKLEEFKKILKPYFGEVEVRNI